MSFTSEPIQYTKEEVNHIWSTYNENLKALETFEQQEDSKKKTMIENLRDSVSKLVEAGKIAIPLKQVANYVYGQLHERNIKYSKGHFYDLFPDEQKGNYSKSSQGNSHKHTWQQTANAPQGIWETCDCGANRINGIQQSPMPDETEKAPKQVAEIITPQGMEFEIIDNFIAISQNNIKGLKLLKQKTTVHKTAIEKQVAKRVSAEKAERIDAVDAQVQQKTDVIKAELAKMGNLQDLLKQTKSTIIQQLQAMRYFDDRTSLLQFQKIMARFAVSIGYDKNDIANFLGITTRHMKLNILQMNNSRKSLLNDIEWFDRCPNPDCGIVLKDFFENRIKEWEQGTPISEAQDYELEALIPTGYQKQVISLQQEIKSLKQKIALN